MNKNDRKEVARALSLLQEAEGILENLKDSEQEKFDNMTEGLQNGERGQAIQTAADALSSAYDSVTEAVGHLEEIE